jgi:hypothetical protein
MQDVVNDPITLLQQEIRHQTASSASDEQPGRLNDEEQISVGNRL